MPSRSFVLPLLALFSLATLVGAAPSPQELLDRVSPSMVAVEYTYAGEAGRRELVSSGVVVGAGGVVMCSMMFMPTQLPDEQLTEFKIILPGADQGDDLELDADFLGRDERTNLAFVKAREKRDWRAVKFEPAAVKVGERVLSVGMLPKSAGYKTYFVGGTVSTLLRGPTPQVLVDGVAANGSIVFNADGAAVGFVNAQPPTSILLNDPRQPNAIPEAARVFTPAEDFMISLNDPPAAGEPLKIPTLGVGQLTGLEKQVAEYFELKGQPAVQIGDVIPGMPADKAGLKSKDVIVKVNGQPLERGDSADETWRILVKRIARMKVGETVTFSVLVDRGQPLKDVKVTLEERPRPRNKAKRFFAEDLGFTAREMVFEDTYERKLQPDAPGVVVAYIKPQSAAASARLANDDLITQVNATPVKTLEQFKTDYEAFRKDRPREAVVLEVLRNGNTQVIRIEPPQ